MPGSGGPDLPPLSSVSHLSACLRWVWSPGGVVLQPFPAWHWDDCEQGLNLVEEAGLGERGEGPGLLASLLGWLVWGLMPGSGALTLTDSSAVFGNLGLNELAHKERGVSEIGAGQRLGGSEQLPGMVARVHLRIARLQEMHFSPQKWLPVPRLSVVVGWGRPLVAEDGKVPPG